MERQRPRPSHEVVRVRSLTWRLACGSWSETIYQGLGRPCPVCPQTEIQKLALKRLSTGLPPPGKVRNYVEQQVITFSGTGAL